MRIYETLFIVQPEAGDEDVKTVTEAVKKLIADSDGSIVLEENWGKRRLAYEIKRHKEGIYVLIRFKSAGDLVEKLKAHFRLADSVIRFIVVLFDEKTLRLEAEQARRDEARRKAEVASEQRRRARDDENDGDGDRDGPVRRSYERRETPAEV